MTFNSQTFNSQINELVSEHIKRFPKRFNTKTEQNKFEAELRREYKEEEYYIRDRGGENTQADHQRRYYHRRGKFMKAINAVMTNLNKPTIDFTGYTDHQIQMQYIYTCKTPKYAKQSQLLYHFARHQLEHQQFYDSTEEEAREYLSGLRPLKKLIFVSKYDNMYEELESEYDNYHFDSALPYLLKLHDRIDKTDKYEYSPTAEDYYSEKHYTRNIHGEYIPSTLIQNEFRVWFNACKV